MFCYKIVGLWETADELFAAWMEKTVTPGPAKALWHHMEHEQIEKIFSGDVRCEVGRP